ncbi:unnamed protein product, partial [Ceratitis capitata]
MSSMRLKTNKCSVELPAGRRRAPTCGTKRLRCVSEYVSPPLTHHLARSTSAASKNSRLRFYWKRKRAWQ